MSLPSPNLDDRNFQQLVEEAKAVIRKSCPEWTDLTPGDPGMVILEAFAYLTEVLIYRVNRIPDKAYIEFLNLLGVRLQPPAAALCRLRFSHAEPTTGDIHIPRGTRVTVTGASGEQRPVFITVNDVTLKADQAHIEVDAVHGEMVEEELAGYGTGLPGQTVHAAHPPIAGLPHLPEFTLTVGVEIPEEEVEVHTPVRRSKAGNKLYQIWREVPNFAAMTQDRHLFVADRNSGKIQFAPAVRQRDQAGNLSSETISLAEVPPKGREIRLWYLIGGGESGNVDANTLTELISPQKGIEVTNPDRAVGGRNAESLDNALQRGPLELHSRERAVTARDFERVARESSAAINRVRAFTLANLWAHATPGTVEVKLVPHVPKAEEMIAKLTPEVLRDYQTDTVAAQVQRRLEERKPLGIACRPSWTRYKTVAVRARVKVHPEEEPALVHKRLLRRLHLMLSPLSIQGICPGWPFGEALRSWDIYKIISQEPGVRSIQAMEMELAHAPDRRVPALAIDAAITSTCREPKWFAASGSRLFRSANRGDSWELIRDFEELNVKTIATFPPSSALRSWPGWLAVIAETSDKSAHIHISSDGGESWHPMIQFKFQVDDIAWLEREEQAILLLATDKGLYELPIQEKPIPIQVLVDPSNPSLSFNAVTVSADSRYGVSVAVASHTRGVYLSTGGTRPDSFNKAGLEGEDVRLLATQHRGPHRYLWAGIDAPGTLKGKGCFRLRLTGTGEQPGGWRDYTTHWEGGGCRSLTFLGPWVLAGTLRRGTLKLNVDETAPAWIPSDVHCGLPLKKVDELEPVDALCAHEESGCLMAGGPSGIYRSNDQGNRYDPCSKRVFSDRVVLPETWLFCSGNHQLSVEREDEA